MPQARLPVFTVMVRKEKGLFFCALLLGGSSVPRKCAWLAKTTVVTRSARSDHSAKSATREN